MNRNDRRRVDPSIRGSNVRHPRPSIADRSHLIVNRSLAPVPSGCGRKTFRTASANALSCFLARSLARSQSDFQLCLRINATDLIIDTWPPWKRGSVSCPSCRRFSRSRDNRFDAHAPHESLRSSEHHRSFLFAVYKTD